MPPSADPERPGTPSTPAQPGISGRQPSLRLGRPLQGRVCLLPLGHHRLPEPRRLREPHQPRVHPLTLGQHFVPELCHLGSERRSLGSGYVPLAFRPARPLVLCGQLVGQLARPGFRRFCPGLCRLRASA